jgi:hypothetical protein
LALSLIATGVAPRSGDRSKRARFGERRGGGRAAGDNDVVNKCADMRRLQCAFRGASGSTEAVFQTDRNEKRI